MPPDSTSSADTPGPPSRRITEVEPYGIEPIPPRERTSIPWNLFRIAFGGANTFAVFGPDGPRWAPASDRATPPIRARDEQPPAFSPSTRT